MSENNKEFNYQDLKESQLFAGAIPGAVESYFEDFVEGFAARGTVILEQGQDNHFLYLLLEGEVELFLGDIEFPPLCRLGPGECFGEMSLIDRGKVSATVVAAEHCHYLLIEDDLLREMAETSHTVACNLLNILSGRLRKDHETISSGQSELKRWEDYALSDALTGLNNRRWLDASLERFISRALKDDSPLSMLMLDVDHFKQFNDHWGHLAGDQALRTVAQVVREQLRPTDMLARYGGEEFVVLLPETPLDEAKQIADRLREAVEQTPCGVFEKVELPPVTVSIGVGVLGEVQGSADLLNCVDEALYQAKRSGRNCLVCYVD